MPAWPLFQMDSYLERTGASSSGGLTCGRVPSLALVGTGEYCSQEIFRALGNRLRIAGDGKAHSESALGCLNRHYKIANSPAYEKPAPVIADHPMHSGAGTRSVSSGLSMGYIRMLRNNEL